MSKRKIRQQKRKDELKQSRLVKDIVPKTDNQANYFKSIDRNIFNFVVGPPGAGKSFIALWHALHYLELNRIEKVVVVRPLVEVTNFSEKSIGSLPGDSKLKMLPWVAGVMDNLSSIIERHNLERLIASDIIEFMPLALCRGRTFNNTFVLVEEAQNITLEGNAMPMILTRLGENSKMVIAGDLNQMDIGKMKSALSDALIRFENTPEFGIIKLKDCDIVRNPIIGLILQKYNIKAI